MNCGSLQADGRRIKIRVADVSGRFQFRKKIVFSILLAIYLVIPFLSLNGKPLLLLDVLARKFYIFGLTFNAQDVFLLFFLLSGMAFALFAVTSLFGRLWCGWACPHTVFLEGVFRRIERLCEGPRAQQLQLASHPWSAEALLRKLIKHVLFLLISWLMSHFFLSYFISAKTVFSYISGSPLQHWPVFVGVVAVTLIFYGHFAWFREQLCLIVCPYGKLQSALTDDDSLVIGYDSKRGEPRGKKTMPGVGDCINCNRCVDVCPTGIDIRNGLQLECVGCANCIDACDAVMQKLGRAPGLIRYDSLNGLQGARRHLLRPRTFVYLFFLLLGFMVFVRIASQRHSFEANVVRSPGQPYVLVNDMVRNQLILHLFNKSSEAVQYKIQLDLPVAGNVILPLQELELAALSDRRIPFFVEIPREHVAKAMSFQLVVTQKASGERVVTSVPFLSPD